MDAFVLDGVSWRAAIVMVLPVHVLYSLFLPLKQAVGMCCHMGTVWSMRGLKRCPSPEHTLCRCKSEEACRQGFKYFLTLLNETETEKNFHKKMKMQWNMGYISVATYLLCSVELLLKVCFKGSTRVADLIGTTCWWWSWTFSLCRSTTVLVIVSIGFLAWNFFFFLLSSLLF